MMLSAIFVLLSEFCLFYLETALRVSGGTTTHHQERANNCIYSIYYLSHHYCYLLLSWRSCNWFECAVGGVYHPQHTQTSFKLCGKYQML